MATSESGMQLRFGPDDDDAFFTTRDELVRRFEAWLSARDRTGDLAADALLLLDFKWRYLDGDLGWWTTDHLEELLLEIYPRKVLAPPDLLALTLPASAAFLTFLADSRLLAPASDRLERLLGHLNELSEGFEVAMNDPSRFGVGKTLLSAMAEEGVDTSDPAAVESWIGAFNARSDRQRETPLAAAVLDLPSVGGGPPRLRPIALPPHHELEAAARSAPALQRLGRFARYAGEGRRLTERGNLRLADARELVEILGTDDQMDERIGQKVFRTRSSIELPGVDSTFRWARAAGFVKVRANRMSVTKAGAQIDRDPLHALLRALDGVVKLGVLTHWFRQDRYGVGWYASDVDAEVPVWLVELYDRGPRKVEDLAAETWDLLLGTFDLDRVEPTKLELHREMVESGIRQILDTLAEIGVLAVKGAEKVRLDYARARLRGGEVELTPLGLWAVNQLIAPLAQAPVVGGLAELDAPRLLERCADLPEDLARGETEVWISRRPTAGRAAHEIVAALREVSDAAIGVGFGALLRLGAEAAPAVRTLADDPRLAPYALVWRVEALDIPAEDVVTADPVRLVAVLDAVLELRGPNALVAWLPLATGAVPGDAGQETMKTATSELWRVRSAAAREVLEAIAAHADRALAKAARKALFKLRTSGGADT